jgi:DNA sulfur modification protein DndB
MGSREYYVAMLPLGVIPRLFKFQDWSELAPQARAQRRLNAKRIPEITRYILDHEDDWLFSSLTASFIAEEHFIPSDIDPNLGILQLPLDAEFLINDGQHRRAAIAEALRQNRTLENQTISVVLFGGESLDRNQQMFSDLNRTVQKTSRSLDILYDHRDPMNSITLGVAEAVPLFRGRVEQDAVSLAVKSAKFVTLSSLYDANVQLLGRIPESATSDEMETMAESTAISFWSSVTDSIREWAAIRDGSLRPAESRAEYVHSHSVGLWAIGFAGGELLRQWPDPAIWKARLGSLSDIDWRRTNREWQGICMIGTDIVTRRQTKAATARAVMWYLGLTENKPQPVLMT